MRIYTKTRGAEPHASTMFFCTLKGKYLSDTYLGMYYPSYNDNRMWHVVYYEANSQTATKDVRARTEAEILILRNGYECVARMTEAFNQQRNETAQILGDYINTYRQS
ncbi:hypothetical protein [Nocardia terpenica]|uniref:Uncharacterized protein n=1 Tax=Nocardia terpenica TaxID=455432 RepID=A0A291RRG8_9NOCA|nr:hypothetical protein [Nocardia terpenica]ATL69849.1 hypothetical protein CRH09_30445 [Nocardia terpenica]